MIISEHNITKLTELKCLLDVMSHDTYVKSKEVLSGSTVGQHVRHILEFYNCLSAAIESGEVNYDARQRNCKIEESLDVSREVIYGIIDFLQVVKADRLMKLIANYGDSSEQPLTISTTLERELAYLLDHTVHHLAIVKIGLRDEKEMNLLGENFGVASSTVRFNNQNTDVPILVEH
ncbi:MAG: hypothetical protein OCD76_03725 [Reichenbachiella sp.]